MTRFDACLLVILKFEGGYSDRAADRGGATNKGITQAVFDEHRRYHELEPEAVKLISDAEVAAIYEDGYWFKAHCDKLPEPIDLLVFDAAVNHGPSRGMKFLQEAMNLPADGLYGLKTAAAVEAAIARKLTAAIAEQMLALRVAFYHRLVVSDPSQRVFLDGWMNRCNVLQKELK